MDRESIKRKIEELLALSKSTNENEALAAIKAARRLMLKYHISASEEMITASSGTCRHFGKILSM